MSKKNENPFKGPESFTEKDTLFGRDRELEDIVGLLIAERIVLFYSASGVGKTSLVQAKLLQRMEREGFHVLPVIRVNQPLSPPNEARDNDNRYIYSMMMSLESGYTGKVNDKTDRSQKNDDPGISKSLMELDINNYLNQCPWITENPNPKLFIFDQFEEILTTDATDHKKRIQFFQELGRVLQNGNRWALFVLREDYLAEFDPYIRYIPTRFTNRYRLEQLRPEMARIAVKEPAKQLKAFTEEEELDTIIDNLRTLPQTSTDSEPRKLPFIDPFHLQILCYNYFEEYLTDGTDAPQIEGGLEKALENYYDKSIAECSQEDLKINQTGDYIFHERELREWIERNLITLKGFRRPLQRDEGKTDGIDNSIIKKMDSKRLLQSSTRHGIKYYELAHDRLVNVIKESNQKWYKEKLRPFQKQAQSWSVNDRLPDKIWTGKKLRKACKDKRKIKKLLDYEKDWFKRCKIESKKNRWLKISIGILMVALCIAAVFLAKMSKKMYLNYNDLEQSEKELKKSNNKIKLTMKELDIELLRSKAMRYLFMQPNHELAALLELQAYNFQKEKTKRNNASIDLALRMTLKKKNFAYKINLHKKKEGMLFTLGSSGARYAILKGGNLIQEYPFRESENDKENYYSYKTEGIKVTAIKYSPEKKYMAAITEKGIELFRLGCEKPIHTFPHKSLDTYLSFNDSGQYIGTIAKGGGNAKVWDIKNRETIATINVGNLDKKDTITALGIDGKGGSVLIGTAKGKVVLYSGSDKFEEPVWLDKGWKGRGKWFDGQYTAQKVSETEVISVEYMSKQNWWAVARKGGVNLYGGVVQIFRQDSDKWSAYKLKKDNNTEILEKFNIEKRNAIVRVEAFEKFAIGAKGNKIAVGGKNGLVGYWNLSSDVIKIKKDKKKNGKESFITAPFEFLYGHWNPICKLIFSDDGSLLFSADNQCNMRAWKIDGVNHKGFVSKEVKSEIVTEIKKKNAVKKGPLKNGPVRGITFIDPDVNQIFDCDIVSGDSSSKNIALNIWKIKNDFSLEHKKHVDLDDPFFTQIRALSLSPDGRFLGIGRRGSKGRPFNILIIDLKDPDYRKYDLKGHEDAVWGIDFFNRKDGERLLATGSHDDGKLIIWKFENIEQAPVKYYEYTFNKSYIRDLAFHPKEGWLVIATKKGEIYKLSKNLNTYGNPVKLVEEQKQESAANAVSFNKDGRLFAVGYSSGKIRIWKIEDNCPNILKEKYAYKREHNGGVNDIQFSPIESDSNISDTDSKYTVLASGGNDGKVRIWNIEKKESSEMPIILSGARGAVKAISFRKDGSRLAAGDTQAWISVWITDTDEIAKLACEQVWRNLSCKEWCRLVGVEYPYQKTCKNLKPGLDAVVGQKCDCLGH